MTAPTTEATQAEGPVAAPEGAAPAELLIAALATFQRDCPVIAKTQTAIVKSPKGEYSYTYADLADVLAVVRPLLARNGLVIVQRTIREPQAGKTILVTELRHVAGASIDSEVDLGQTSANAQQFGGALTYLRRYELTTLLGIAAEDDTDAQHVERPNGNGQAPAPAPLPSWAQPASEESMGNWVTALLQVGVDEETARAIGDGLVKAWGHFPSGATAIAKAIAKALNPPADPPAADGDLPDTAGPPPPGVSGNLPLDDLELAAARDAAAQAASGEEPQDGPPIETTAPPPAAAGPATIPLPIAELRAVEDGAGADDERRRIIAAAGCLCQDPLGPDGAKNTACPLVGHGVPF